MAFSLHAILGKYEFAIAANRTSEDEIDEPTSVVSETELAFGFAADHNDEDPLEDEDLAR